MRFVIVGHPEGRRVRFFQRALTDAGLPLATVLPYPRVLTEPDTLEDALKGGATLRLESPGGDFNADRHIIALGADVEDAPGPQRIDARAALALEDEVGRVQLVRQWYLGFRRWLRRVQTLPNPVLNPPADIEVMFDKRLTHAGLTARGVPMANALGPIDNYDHLRETMRTAGLDRVFVKLAHGSSASGVIALSTRHDPVGMTSMERVVENGRVRFYNSLRIRRYTEGPALRDAINFVCAEGAQVEAWWPKARLAGKAVDLRVVTIAGRARHTVVRQGSSPMTNLHLGGGRGDLAALRAMLPKGVWDSAMATCEDAAACFSNSLYCGVDLMFHQSLDRWAIVEVNAFGDLLPGILSDGLDTYAAELAAALGDAP